MATEHYSTSKETLFALAHNALSIELLEDGYYCALRFSKEQEQGYNTHPLFRAMAGTSASVCLRFQSLSNVMLHLKRYSQSLLPKKKGGSKLLILRLFIPGNWIFLKLSTFYMQVRM